MALPPANPATLAQWAAFVHPGLATAAAGLGLIPVLIHLLNRRRHRRVPWAAMTFLLAARRESSKRLFIEQWLLLAVRVLLITLLGLALARPYLRATSLAALGEHRTHRVIVLDDSMSMQATDDQGVSRWQQALSVAGDLLVEFPTGDAVSLVTMAAPATAVLDHASFDRRAARRLVDERKPTFQGTDVSGTLQRVTEILKQSPAAEGNRAVYIISDLARHDWDTGQTDGPIALAARQVAGEAGVSLIHVPPPQAANASIQALVPDSPLVSSAMPTRFNIVVANDGMNVLRDASVDVFRGPQLARRLALSPIEPGQAQTLSFSLAFDDPGGFRVRATLNGGDGDCLEADNQRFLSVEARDEIPVLVVDGRPGLTRLEGAAGYLITALAPRVSAADPVVFRPKTVQPLDLDTEVWDEYGLIVLCNVERLAETQWKRLDAYVRNGGGLLITLGKQVDLRHYATLGFADGSGPAPAAPGDIVSTTGLPEGGVALRMGEPVHPMLSEFAHAPDSSLFLSRIETYVRLAGASKGAQVVLRYSDDAPALLVAPHGAGRCALLTTTVDMQWSNLAAKMDFVPLMLKLAGYLTRTAGSHRTLDAGLPWSEPLRLGERGLVCEFTDPDDKAQTARFESQGEQMRAVSAPMQSIGFGVARVGSRVELFASNPVITESDLAALASAELEDIFGRRVAYTRAVDRTTVGPLTRRSTELSTTLLGVVFLLMLVELSLASRRASKRGRRAGAQAAERRR